MPRPSELNESLFEALAQALQSGASNSSAAAIMGVSRQTYQRWLLAGERDAEGGTDSPHARLWRVHNQARGQARRVAETQVFKDNPLAWLTKGPGRDEWAEHQVIDATIQADVHASVETLLQHSAMAHEVVDPSMLLPSRPGEVCVLLPSDFKEGSEMQKAIEAALCWQKENGWLLVSEDEEGEEASGE